MNIFSSGDYPAIDILKTVDLDFEKNINLIFIKLIIVI